MDCLLQIRKTWPLLLVLSVAVTGCHLFRGSPGEALRSDSSAAADPAKKRADDLSSAAEADPPVCLTKMSWVLRANPNGEPLAKETPRWLHQELESFLAQQDDRKSQLAGCLEQDNPIVSTNAAIGLARLSDSRGLKQLSSAATNTPLALPIRQAAIEAIALHPPELAAREFDKLLEKFGPGVQQSRTAYVPALHAELVRAYSRVSLAGQAGQKTPPPYLVAALQSPADEVKIAALRCWPDQPKSSSARPPKQPHAAVVDALEDSSWRVRLAAVGAYQKYAEIPAAPLIAALREQRLEVRLAIIEALGNCRESAATDALQELYDSPIVSEKIQATVVRAFTEQGAVEKVLAARNNPSWRVRQAVAEALPQIPNKAGKEIASQFISDSSIQVIRATLTAIESWPPTLSVPVWFQGLRSPSLSVRQQSAEQLKPYVSEVENLQTRANPQQVAADIIRLENEWEKKAQSDLSESVSQTHESSLAAQADRAVQTAPPQEPTEDDLARVERALVSYANRTTSDAERQAAKKGLLDLGKMLPVALEKLASEKKVNIPEAVYQDILPQVDPLFHTLRDFASQEVLQRREVARQLVQVSEKRLPDLAHRRLLSQMLLEQDLLVWQTIQTLLAEDVREGTVDLQHVALGHDAAEVRKNACLYFARHANAKDIQSVLELLEDPNPSVVLAAIEAIGKCDSLENPLPLSRMLANRDKTVQLATAAALIELDLELGHDALLRLAHDRDGNVRREAAMRIGSLGKPRYTPILIQLLDDNLAVRREALRSLTTIHQQDVGRGDDKTTPSMAEQIRRWKRWHVANQKKQSTYRR